MYIWILQTGEPIHADKENSRPMRGINLANFLISKNHKINFITSNFNHQKKIHRYNQPKELILNKNLKINLINSPGYKKNIGIRRLFDHFILSLNLAKYLLLYKGPLPDYIFIGFPPIETSFVMSFFAILKKIPYAVDVKDKWPEIFVEYAPKNIKFFIRIVFFPYFLFTKFTFTKASLISGPTNSYISWVKKFTAPLTIRKSTVAPLVGPKLLFKDNIIESAYSWWEERNISKDNNPKLIFVGAINKSYNFEPILEMALYFKNNLPNLKIIICGSGPMENYLKNKTSNYKNVVFPGWINDSKIYTLYSMATASLIPYKSITNFEDNITNKVIDSLSYGVPILTSLKGEVRELINKYHVGYTYNNAKGLINNSIKLINSSEIREGKSLNSKRAYEELFEYKKSYNRLLNNIELSAKNK